MFDAILRGVKRAKKNQEAAETLNQPMRENDMASGCASNDKGEDFLKSIGAKKLPVLLYAAWLSAYIEAGGRITHWLDDYSFSDWKMATKWPKTTVAFKEGSRVVGGKIPAAYGASSLNLFVFPQLTAACNLENSSGDLSPGWEYGHTRVITLSMREEGFVAWTNSEDFVVCYPEIAEMISQRSPRELLLLAMEH